MDAEKPFPRFSQAIILVVILFVVQVFLGTVLAIGSIILRTHSLANDPAIMGLSIVVSFLVVLILALLWSKEPWRKVFYFSPFRLYILAPLFVFFLGLSILVSEVDNILRFFMPMPGFLKEFLKDMIAPGISSFITVVIIGPVTEELFFRGIILKGFLKQYNPWKAIVISSLIFTLFHMNPYQFFAAFTTGLILGWIYAKTSSVWLCIICHAIYNSFIFSARLLTVSIPGFTADFPESNSAHFQPLWFNLTGLALIAVGFWGIVKTLPITFPSPEQTTNVDLENHRDLPED